jgi:hypothetical protein
MNRAATPRFFSPGVNACSRAEVNIRPSTDSPAKDNKSKPVRNPVERSRVGCSPCCESGDARCICTLRLCGVCQLSLTAITLIITSPRPTARAALPNFYSPRRAPRAHPQLHLHASAPRVA